MKVLYTLLFFGYVLSIIDRTFYDQLRKKQ